MILFQVNLKWISGSALWHFLSNAQGKKGEGGKYSTSVHSFMLKCVYIHTYLQTPTHTHMHVCMCVCVTTCVVCVCECPRSCVCVRACTCVRLRMLICTQCLYCILYPVYCKRGCQTCVARDGHYAASSSTSPGFIRP